MKDTLRIFIYFLIRIHREKVHLNINLVKMSFVTTSNVGESNFWLSNQIKKSHLL